MKPILVIGATGTVGRQAVSQLTAAGFLVRALARNPHINNLPPQTELVRGDLTIPDSLEPALVGIDTVFLARGAENMLLNAWAAAAGQSVWVRSTVA